MIRFWATTSIFCGLFNSFSMRKPLYFKDFQSKTPNFSTGQNFWWYSNPFLVSFHLPFGVIPSPSLVSFHLPFGVIPSPFWPFLSSGSRRCKILKILLTRLLAGKARFFEK